VNLDRFLLDVKDRRCFFRRCFYRRNKLNVIRLPAQTVISQTVYSCFRITVVVGFVPNFLGMKPWCDPGLTLAEMPDTLWLLRKALVSLNNLGEKM